MKAPAKKSKANQRKDHRFKTTDMYTIATLQEMFGFELPSVHIARRTVKFICKFNEGNCVFS